MIRVATVVTVAIVEVERVVIVAPHRNDHSDEHNHFDTILAFEQQHDLFLLLHVSIEFT